MRLNKYIAHCGICSRRKAVELIKNGAIQVNDKVVVIPYYEVQNSDVVTHKGKKVRPIELKYYLLLNKPKNTITTKKDESGRKTVMDLIGDFKEKNVHPVGRLDRQTTGLLLLTNDGDLTHKLSHPSSEVKKIYHVQLNRKLTKTDLKKIRSGLTLDDGYIKPDAIELVKDGKGKEVGIELHSGRNRIIRRIFEHLGYEIERLDRVYLAGLTKKDLPRGRYRQLTKREVIMLKHFV